MPWANVRSDVRSEDQKKKVLGRIPSTSFRVCGVTVHGRVAFVLLL